MVSEAAERLLSRLAALACTACKCAVLLADRPARGQHAEGTLVPADSTELLLLRALSRCEQLAGTALALAATASRMPSERGNRLLHCVRLQRAEARVRLLPLASQQVTQSLEEEGGAGSTAPLVQQQGGVAAASLRVLAAAARILRALAAQGNAAAALGGRLAVWAASADWLSPEPAAFLGATAATMGMNGVSSSILQALYTLEQQPGSAPTEEALPGLSWEQLAGL
ncbi:hypothetical protein ABPG75_008318 [Micractinium tetrahymenae]